MLWVVANVFTGGNASFWLAMCPSDACWLRSHASGDAYAVPFFAGTTWSRQHEDAASPPIAVIAMIAVLVLFGSSAPKDCHAPSDRCWFTRYVSACTRSVSVGLTFAATSAWITRLVVSMSASVAVGSLAKSHPPEACWPPRTYARVSAGTAPLTSHFARAAYRVPLNAP